MSGEDQEQLFFSAADLARMRLPGLPWSERGIRVRARQELWESRVVRATGGRGGTRTEYSPPKTIRAAIAGARDSVESTVAAGESRRAGRRVPEPLPIQIGRRLRTVRGTLDLDDFAAQLDIPPSKLATYEAGEELPKGSVVVQLYERYRVDPTWLICGVNAPKESHAEREAHHRMGKFASYGVAVKLAAKLLQATDAVLKRKRLAFQLAQRVEIVTLALGVLEALPGDAASLEQLTELEASSLEGAVEMAITLDQIAKRV